MTENFPLLGVGSKTVFLGVHTLPRSLLDARKAFALACVEQLVPKLSEETIQTRVYPLCHQCVHDCHLQLIEFLTIE